MISLRFNLAMLLGTIAALVPARKRESFDAELDRLLASYAASGSTG